MGAMLWFIQSKQKKKTRKSPNVWTAQSGPSVASNSIATPLFVLDTQFQVIILCIALYIAAAAALGAQ